MNNAGVVACRVEKPSHPVRTTNQKDKKKPCAPSSFHFLSRVCGVVARGRRRARIGIGIYRHVRVRVCRSTVARGSTDRRGVRVPPSVSPGCSGSVAQEHLRNQVQVDSKFLSHVVDPLKPGAFKPAGVELARPNLELGFQPQQLLRRLDVVDGASS